MLKKPDTSMCRRRRARELSNSIPEDADDADMRASIDLNRKDHNRDVKGSGHGPAEFGV